MPAPGVTIDPADLQAREVAATTPVHRAFEPKWGYDAFNPGFGDTRFAPVPGAALGAVPTAYFAMDETSALLESVLHEVHHMVGDRVIYEAVVRNWALAYVELPTTVRLVDLSDDRLAHVGLDREQIVATMAEHYACTQEWSAWLHGAQIQGAPADGILWHSRQAELHDPSLEREVFVLWGDRAPQGPGTYPLVGPGVRNLVEGAGRIALDALASDLGARIET